MYDSSSYLPMFYVIAVHEAKLAQVCEMILFLCLVNVSSFFGKD